MTSFDATHVLLRQTVGALHSIACDILMEDPSAEEHAERLVWARRILSDNDGPVAEAGCWIWAMLTNYTLATNPTTTDDGTVKTVAAGFLPIMLRNHRHV